MNTCSQQFTAFGLNLGEVSLIFFGFFSFIAVFCFLIWFVSSLPVSKVGYYENLDGYQPMWKHEEKKYAPPPKKR